MGLTVDCLGFYLYPVKELGFLLVLGVACGKYRIEGVVFQRKGIMNLYIQTMLGEDVGVKRNWRGVFPQAVQNQIRNSHTSGRGSLKRI